jgi:hypothetical protein
MPFSDHAFGGSNEVMMKTSVPADDPTPALKEAPRPSIVGNLPGHPSRAEMCLVPLQRAA